MKITPSTLVNIILSAILLTSIGFIGVTAQTQQYDPWIDINEDGDINMLDAIRFAGVYGTSGDPAKNVTVINWPQNIDVTITSYANNGGSLYVTVDPTSISWEYIDTVGYRKISIGFDPVGTTDLDVSIVWLVGGLGYTWESFNLSDNELRVYEVLGRTMGIGVYNPDIVAHNIYLDYYITA